MISLTSERLLIRDHTLEDLPTHHALLSSAKEMWYLQDIMTHSPEESEANLRAAMAEIGQPQRKYYFLRIEQQKTKEHIGEIGYTVDEFTPMGTLVGVGYFIRAPHWGKGYTTEALRAVLRFAFEKNGVYRVSCGCLRENAASERVMQKCGLIWEAQRKEAQWHDGRLKDRVEYRLLRAEWEALAKETAALTKC